MSICSLIVSALLAWPFGPGSDPQEAAPKARRQFQQNEGRGWTEVVKPEVLEGKIQVSGTAGRWHGTQLGSALDDSWCFVKVFRDDDERKTTPLVQLQGFKIAMKKGEVMEVGFGFEVPLPPGRYAVQVGQVSLSRMAGDPPGTMRPTNFNTYHYVVK